MSSTSPLVYQLGFRTDKGQQRSHNEDAGATFELAGADAGFVVCDGMGGLRSGDVAANEAVRTIRDHLQKTFETGNPDPLKALNDAFRLANDAVNALAKPDDEATQPAPRRGSGRSAPATPARDEGGASQAVMGTTAVAGILQNDTLYLAHAGDSRAYRWRRGHLTRFTDDHSFVGERVRAGDMTEAEARVSRFRNIVTRAIGIDETVQPELHREPLEPGDRIVVCTDGLTTMLDDPDIAALMNSSAFVKASADKAAQMLVDAANKRGGHDNVTILLIGAGGDGAATVLPAPGVYDIDRPRARRKRGNGFGWFLFGIVFALTALVSALYFYRPARIRAARLLGVSVPASTTVPTTTNASGGTTLDFARLAYDPPVRFADLLARGDLLSYSAKAGLYFVADGSGKVALLSRTGVGLRSVETVEPFSSPLRGLADNSKIPSTHIFMTADPQGNVYISYTKRGIVEKKGTDGKLLAILRGFVRPEAVAVDDSGNVYVVDFNDIKVCRARAPRSANTAPAKSEEPGNAASGEDSASKPASAISGTGTARQTGKPATVKPIRGSQ